MPISELLSSKLLPKLIEKLYEIQRTRKDEFKNIGDIFGNISNLAEYYIEPNCQHGNPADEDDVSSPIFRPVFTVLNEIIEKVSDQEDGRKQLFILADAGMGKTSLLIMLKFYHLCSFWPKQYDCKLLKLGEDTIIDIRSMGNKAKTILLLDALDEDQSALKNYNSRICDLLKETSKFKNVIITCRTQFFPIGEKDPFQRSGMINISGYTCPVMYLSLFNNDQIYKYLKNRFNYSADIIQKAESILSKMKTLKARPLLLAHIQDLLESANAINDTYNVYLSLVGAWINREARKQGKSNSNSLMLACLRVAFEMTLMKQLSIEPIKIDELIIKYPDISSLNRMDIGGRSLLNRNSSGSFRFSHYSIQEFLIAESIIRGTVSNDEISRCLLSDLTLIFLHCYSDYVEHSIDGEKKLQGFSFSRKKIMGDQLIGVNLVGCRANSTIFNNTNFHESFIYYGNFEKSTLTSVSFDKSCVSRCVFNDTHIQNTSFKDVKMLSSKFPHSIMKNCDFTNSDLSECDFAGTHLIGCNFSGANLAKASFSDAKVDGSIFVNCKNFYPSQITKSINWEKAKYDSNTLEIMERYTGSKIDEKEGRGATKGSNLSMRHRA